MEGVTTAIVAFIFVCVVFPNIIKRKPQFYAALTCVLAVIFLNGLGELTYRWEGWRVLFIFLDCLLDIFAIILLVLAAGGLSFKQLIGEVNLAIDSVRKDISTPSSPPSAPPPTGPGTSPPAAGQ